jgi:hypothetical protein
MVRNTIPNEVGSNWDLLSVVLPYLLEWVILDYQHHFIFGHLFHMGCKNTIFLPESLFPLHR